ncbi:hypothetical protein TNCV_5030871 [Trichonephila clavipes]|nr:hypothetical protein TNCV_5030871 [Trichonephila clavipes]
MSPSQYGGYDLRLVTEWVRVRIPRDVEDEHLDDVEKDLTLIGINPWKTTVTHRANWRRISESALACKRLLNL